MFKEKIGTLTKTSSTTVQLSGTSLVKLGGQFRTLTSPSLSTAVAGIGGLDTGSITASSLYYVYAVYNGTITGLTASLSASSPTGFTRYKKVGAFYTSVSSAVSLVVKHNTQSDISFLAGLASDQSILTSVNAFLTLDTVINDTVIGFGSNGFTTPEPGTYSMSAMILTDDLTSGDLHTSKIYTTTLFAIANNRVQIPVTDFYFPNAIPKIDVFLPKGELVRLNVDSSSDASYVVRANDGGGNITTWLSIYKKTEIDWKDY